MALRAILTDIEGTTSDIAFVKAVLFPYARAHLADFVSRRGEEPAVRDLLDEAAALAGTQDDAATLQVLVDWIDADRKITPLKSLQGLIWAEGYASGDLRGHIYPDALAQLQAWHAAGLRLYVYSSGSVAAQKLLFGHSEAGDLRPLFSGYFDTHVGGKREPKSYRRILAAIGLSADEVVFLSDVAEELDAARAAGLHTRWLLRDTPPPARAEHDWAGDFRHLQLPPGPI